MEGLSSGSRFFGRRPRFRRRHCEIGASQPARIWLSRRLAKLNTMVPCGTLMQSARLLRKRPEQMPCMCTLRPPAQEWMHFELQHRRCLPTAAITPLGAKPTRTRFQLIRGSVPYHRAWH